MRHYNQSTVETVTTWGNKIRYLAIVPRAERATAWPNPLRKSGYGAECDAIKAKGGK